jgi:hypothetical protein
MGFLQWFGSDEDEAVVVALPGLSLLVVEVVDLELVGVEPARRTTRRVGRRARIAWCRKRDMLHAASTALWATRQPLRLQHSTARSLEVQRPAFIE